MGQNDNLNGLKDLLESIVKALVDQPEKVKISCVIGNQTNILELKVSKEDVGKVVGRNGRTADALRTLMNCCSAKLGQRNILQIIDS